jgi:beta-phosphoglucomutase-like phosphatase (HAD superfamily)
VRPEAVIFDIDGTLIDSIDPHARPWVEAVAHFGYHVSFEQVRPQIGKGGDQLIPAFISVQTNLFSTRSNRSLKSESKLQPTMRNDPNLP